MTTRPLPGWHIQPESRQRARSTPGRPCRRDDRQQLHEGGFGWNPRTSTLCKANTPDLNAASRKSDRRLLLISGALGIQFTGEAIGEAIRSLSIPSMAKAIALTGSVVGMLADLACLYLWWQTFRSREPVHAGHPSLEKSRGEVPPRLW